MLSIKISNFFQVSSLDPTGLLSTISLATAGTPMATVAVGVASPKAPTPTTPTLGGAAHKAPFGVFIPEPALCALSPDCDRKSGELTGGAIDDI